ncbi:MAG: 4Fe-4S dicluster domain-containing protein [Phycisphaerales bacterium]|nr:MAG: 4Fe-4S dicluster domain-containing protein [Phycisphaerales bacterium]
MSVNRRDFLRIAGAAGVAGATSTVAAGSAPATRVSDDWMGMLTDLTLCVGCRKCEWACKDANQLPGQQPIDAYDDKSVFERRRRTDAINLTVVNRYDPAAPGEQPVYVKTQCMHCFEPACASACLVAAFRKTSEGPVLYNENVCIGCRYCMVACPFEMPAYTYDDPFSPAVRKCTMCFDRITKEGGVPACAATCPVEAITFGKRSELLALARDKIAAEPDKYVNHIYGEHEAGGTCWLYIAGKPFDELGFRTDIAATPYPELTRGFLSAVPLVLTLWPALLMGAYAFTQRRDELARAEAEPGENAATEPQPGDHDE